MVAFASILGVSDHWYEGDLAANLACVKHGMKIAQDYGYPVYQVLGPLWATPALAAQGSPLAALDELCRLLGKLPADTRCIQMPLYRAMLAAEYGRIGQIDRARGLAASAESLMKKTGERWAAPEIYRIRGTLLCYDPERDDRSAMRLFRRSLASAAELGAIGWELRTALSLARLLRTKGEGARAEARDLLVSARVKFPDIETSADLRQADELLQELS